MRGCLQHCLQPPPPEPSWLPSPRVTHCLAHQRWSLFFSHPPPFKNKRWFARVLTRVITMRDGGFTLETFLSLTAPSLFPSPWLLYG